MLRICLSWCFLFYRSGLFAQVNNEPSWISENEQEILASMNLNVSIPIGLDSELGFECFDEFSKLSMPLHV